MSILLFALGNYLNNRETKVEAPPARVEYKDLIQKQQQEMAQNMIKKLPKKRPREFTDLVNLETKKIIDEMTEEPEIIKNEPNDVVSSLSGDVLTKEEFMSNSQGIPMMPFFSGNLKQNMNEAAYDTKLGLFTGRDSTIQRRKTEREPLFKPTKGLNNTYGMRNINNEISNRYISGQNRSKELPFKQVRVGPGLDDGYSAKPSGAFHDMSARDAAMPKNVDQLRAQNNPKITYKGRVNSGKKGENRTSEMKVNKYRPEQVLINKGTERFFTTVGARVKDAKRENFYFANKGRKGKHGRPGGAFAPTNIKPKNIPITQKSKRNVLRPVKPLGPYAANKFKSSDYGKKSFFARPNERDTTQKRTNISNIVTNVKALVTPIQDAIKRTKKENVIGNNRPEGNMNSSVPKKHTVYDPNDVARTTIKETTIDNDRDGNLNGPNKLTTYDPNDIARTTIKETTIDNDRDGNLNGPNKLTAHDPNDIARTTIKETTIHNNRSGDSTPQQPNRPRIYKKDTAPKITLRNTLDEIDFNANVSPSNNTPNKPTNYDIQEAKPTIKETTIDNVHSSNVRYRKDGGYMTNEQYAPATNKQELSDYEYTGIPDGAEDGLGYLTNETHAPATNKQELSDNEYTGGMNSKDKRPMSYDESYNARLNVNKEKIAKGRRPTQNNVKICSGEDTLNVLYKKQMSGINAERVEKSRLYTKINDKHSINNTNIRNQYSNMINKDRLEPELLDAFNKNPYTQSLQSYSWA